MGSLDWVNLGWLSGSWVYHKTQDPDNYPLVRRQFGTFGVSISVVGGLEHGFYVSIYWEFHHPN
jgi:hypothetical protein